MLFLVEPTKDAREIQRQVLLIGAPADALQQLVNGGYVAAVTAVQCADQAGGAASIEDQVAQFRVAKAFMNDTVVDALGIRAFMFTLKLERCATAADLATLLPDYTQALLKKLDREAVRAHWSSARARSCADARRQVGAPSTSSAAPCGDRTTAGAGTPTLQEHPEPTKPCRIVALLASRHVAELVPAVDAVAEAKHRERDDMSQRDLAESFMAK